MDPATGGELLLSREQRESLLQGLLVLWIAEDEPGLCARTERDGVRVGVLAREGIGSAGERIEEFAVEEIALGEISEGLIAREAGGGEEILRHHKGLVVGRILFADAVAALCGKQRLGASQDAA